MKSIRPFMPAVMSFIALVIALSSTAAAQDDKPFTVAVIPDTQYYADVRHEYAKRRWGKDCREYFFAQTEWIARAKDDLNIAFAVHAGDITELDYDPEWKIAVEAMSKLDGVVPYALCVGNHDMGIRPKDGDPAKGWMNATNRNSHFDQYFPKAKYEKEPWFGGSMDTTLTNAYYTFEQVGMKFMVLSIEFKPRNEALEWANKVVRQHPEHRVIVLNHAYLQSHKNGSYRLTKHLDNYQVEGNNAEKMWNKFVSRHPNIFMVLCGHIGGAGRDEGEGLQISRGMHGNIVYEILADYQFWTNGGGGWMRYMTFHPNQDKIEVFTYNPVEDKHLEEKISRFTLDYPMTGPKAAKSITVRKPGRIRIATYNVRNFFDVHDNPYTADESSRIKSNVEISTLAEAVRAMNADVVAFQEIENEHVMKLMIDRHLGDMGYEYIEAGKSNDGRGITVGIASRLPIDSVTSHRFRTLTLENEEKTWNFARNLVRFSLDAGKEQPLELYVVHLKSKRDGENDPKSAKWRLSEAKEIRRVIKKHATETGRKWYALIGDLNDLPESNPIQHLIGANGDASMLLDAHRDVPKSRRVTYLGERYRGEGPVDYILLSPSLDKRIVPDSATVLSDVEYPKLTSGSDHAPVMVTLDLN